MVLALTESGRWGAQKQALGGASYWYRLRLAALRPGALVEWQWRTFAQHCSGVHPV